MGRADDRREPTGPIVNHSRMDDEAQRKRSDMFRQITQGRGAQQIYGSGKPENVPKAKPPKGKVAKS